MPCRINISTKLEIISVGYIFIRELYLFNNEIKLNKKFNKPIDPPEELN